MGQADHGWTGRHRIRIARIDGAVVLHFTRVTSQGGRVRTDIGDFFRKDYPRIRPSMDRFAVRIWIVGGTGRLDVDNVAKACLDALTGAVWHDDRQVDELRVTRLGTDPGDAGGGIGGDPALYLVVRPLAGPPDAGALDTLLTAIAVLG
ncbi:MAG: RusA family crossover junction endodeoxyribonuclease [Azospirillaceae bacterium]